MTEFSFKVETPAAASEAQATRLLERLTAAKGLRRPSVATEEVSGALTATFRLKAETVWEAVAAGLGPLFAALGELGIASDAGARVAIAAPGHVTRFTIEHGEQLAAG